MRVEVVIVESARYLSARLALSALLSIPIRKPPTRVHSARDLQTQSRVRSVNLLCASQPVGSRCVAPFRRETWISFLRFYQKTRPTVQGSPTSLFVEVPTSLPCVPLPKRIFNLHSKKPRWAGKHAVCYILKHSLGPSVRLTLHVYFVLDTAAYDSRKKARTRPPTVIYLNGKISPPVQIRSPCSNRAYLHASENMPPY